MIHIQNVTVYTIIDIHKYYINMIFTIYIYMIYRYIYNIYIYIYTVIYIYTWGRYQPSIWNQPLKRFTVPWMWISWASYWPHWIQRWQFSWSCKRTLAVDHQMITRWNSPSRNKGLLIAGRIKGKQGWISMKKCLRRPYSSGGVC